MKEKEKFLESLMVIFKIWLWDLFYEKLIEAQKGSDQDFANNQKNEITNLLINKLENNYDERLIDVFVNTLHYILFDTENLERNIETFRDKLIIYKSEKLTKWLYIKVKEQEEEIKRLKSQI